MLLRPFYLPREFPQLFVTFVYIHPKASVDAATYNFYKYSTCATQLGKCLDLCYGSVKRTYKSFRRAPLQMSDHNVVYLLPSYKLVPKKQKLEQRLVLIWSDNSIQCLQECYSCTNWDMFKNVCGYDIDELTDTLSAYVTFCEFW